MKKILYLIMLVTCCAISSHAQVTEICANSIDDDGDGFIDCFDSECANATVCTGGYIGNDLNCEAKPSEFPKFSLALESASENGTAIHLGRIAVGDIDGDGIPEMVTTNQYSKKIFILNGDNTAGINTIQKELSISYSPSYIDILIANLDNGNGKCAEIFTVSTGWRLRAYDCNLTELWYRDLPGDPGMMGVADFNGDGIVELYARNAIYNAHTGAVIVAPTDWDHNDKDRRPNGGPVAVDILKDDTKNAHVPGEPDDNLELVVGGTIYSVNIAGGTITPEKNISNLRRKTESDATSIADYNLDGSLDVIASGKNGDDGNTTIFFWDVKTGIVKTYADPIAGSFTIQNCQGTSGVSTGQYYKNGWHKGTGRVNIADLDGDGKLNAAYVSGKFLYALKEDMTLLWKITVNEETSGNTGCTLFDFNGDGQSEVVYRDEKFIYIINGTNGSVFTQQPCVSRTNREYPIVADVDADGNTELCVTCRTVDFIQNGGITDPNNADYFKADEANFCDLGNSRYSHVRVFRSGSEPWVPARRVWNQHGYFNVNVNDNLTIPKIQQKHHIVFSENVCTDGKNRPLNSFLNQSPFLNSLGCPKYASPDLAYIENSLVINQPTCPNKNFTISFQVTNLGDVSLSGTVPITFYNGNPTQAGATKLNTININLNAFQAGSIHSVTNATVNGPGSPFTLYIVLNDGGTTVPTPIQLPNTNFIECDYGNNILSAPVNPLPVALTALKVQDNIQCAPATSPNNGAVRAFVPNGASENTTDYNFYWSIGDVAKPLGSTDHTGVTYTGIDQGTYTVYAIHKTANCYSEIKKVDVGKVNAPVNIEIVQDLPLDNCKTDNAKLRAIVNGDTNGTNVGQYTFTWYKGNDIFGEFVGDSHVKEGLGALTYTVLVKHKATGCQNIDSYTIQSQTVKPVPTITKTDAICSATGTGSASATVGGVTSGYTFAWSKGNTAKPTPDFTGATYSNLVAGTYTVVATRNATQCSSDPVKVTVNQTIPPVVSASVVSHQTSCDATQPTGSASAAVGGVTTGYTFEWFFGQNTLLDNRVATTSTATGLKVGTYTVKATSIATGCSATEEVTIDFAVVTPSLSLASQSNITQCAPPNGSITVSVSPGAPADYTFSWYNGDGIKTTPDYSDTDNTLSGLEAGTYTVVGKFDARHCETAPLKVVIDYLTPTITFNPTNIVRPSDCNDNRGELTVSVSAPGNTVGFDFEWRKGQEPFAEPAITTVTSTTSSSTATSLTAGAYTLIATNRENGCSSSEVFDLPFDNAQVLTFQNKLNIGDCVPGNNGFIEIRLTPTTSFVDSDYRIDVFEGKNDLGPDVTPFASQDGVDGQTFYDWSGLEPKFYTFVAVTINQARSTFDCRSVPVTVEIVKNTTNPVFTANPSINNVNCVGAPGTGQLSVTIANPADHSFTWFEGPDASSPILGTNTSGVAAGASATNLPAGKYTVVVTKNITPSAGCFSTATYQIFDDVPTISIAQSNVMVTNITQCDMPDAEASVTAVTEAGAAAPVGDYTFEWFSSTASGPQLIAGETGSTLSGRPAGTYYVRAINTVSTCSTSGLVEFIIQDQTANTVGVDLMSFIIPTQCLKPANITGSLEVQGTGNSVSGYTYTWHAGQTTSDPVIPGATEIASTLAAGFYTVEVLNNTTQCSITETYELPLDLRPIPITASAEPLTVCFDTPKDGSVFALVTNGFKTEYSYFWFEETVKPVEDFSSTPFTPNTNLHAGNFIVRIIDQNDAACFTSDTVRVEDRRMMPVVVAEPLAPLTMCDPTRPDGVAAAHVDGKIISHRFDWFNNAPPTGSVLYSGSQASGLGAGVYSVVATDFVTGCSGTTQVTIDIEQVPIPLPEIEILSMVTSCISDNGALTAAVDGITRDYVFDWYIGNAEKSSPDFVGEIYEDLAVGIYAVTATSRITGCKSPLVTEEIHETPKYPDFSITAVPTVCREDSSEPATGFAALFMTNSVDTDSIIWSMNGTVIATGPLATGLDAGVYEVTVISSLGCETTKPFEVKSEIRPFNGVSRNHDGQNDIFHINCIENFPSNMVKIFNRAGTMVYEAEGYDNNGTYFDGQSNRGVSLMGTNLPGGTYFYIIDKRDGSKPIAGYLEIVN
jgi:gliding motility-associated-like protein